MPAILGLRGTGDWATNERPTNWREAILYLFPNGDAPLMALMSKLGSEPTDDPQFNWWEKSLPTDYVTASSYSGDAVTGTGTGAGTIVVASGSNLCPKGTLLENFTTGELLYVTADPTSDTSIAVERNVGGLTTPSDPTAADILHIVSTAYREASPLPTSTGTNPTQVKNYTQIVRTPLSMTRTALKTHLRTGEAWRNAKIEALQIHSIRLENMLLHSQRSEKTFEGKLRRTTGGIRWFITGKSESYGTTNKVTVGDFMESGWDEYHRQVFEYGSLQKAGFCGSTALKPLNTMAKNKGFTMLSVGDGAWGARFVEFQGIMGILYLKIHPLLTRITYYKNDMIVVDLPKLVWRYVDDTTYVTFRQGRGDDFRADEFFTEAGLELHFAQTHWWLADFGNFLQ